MPLTFNLNNHYLYKKFLLFSFFWKVLVLENMIHLNSFLKNFKEMLYFILMKQTF